MIELFSQASLLIKLVLLILACLSVLSWGIILYKSLHLYRASQESRTMLEALHSCHSSSDLNTLSAAAQACDASPLALMVQAAIPGEGHRSREEIRRRLRSSQTHETDRLESYLTFLATTGATAPFIGLLGTVWGIMDAFRGIGTTGSASLAVVAPAIAEALVTTAAGLAAAIPAVMAYNFFVNWVRKLTMVTEDFSEALQRVLAVRAE